MEEKNKSDSVIKAESTPKTTVPSSSAREIGQPRIVTSSTYIEDSRKDDLKMPKRLCTFDNMCLDDAVNNSIDVTNLHTVNALANGEFKGKGSKKSQIAADFLNYCIRNMTHGTWLEACLNAVTDLKYGFSSLNIVTEKRAFGQYSGNRVLRKLSPRDQKSVYGWLFDQKGREFLGFVQKPSIISGKKIPTGFADGLTAASIPRYEELGYPILRRDQILHFAFNKTNNNPQGNPPLAACYQAWMEKKLVEKYEIVGVSKDLGGAVVLRVPSELIERANDPVNYPAEAAEYKALQQDAANLQAGETSYIVLTSDFDEVTKTPLYDLKLQGIEGGGKQYKTSEIIDQKRKSIYNTFGAGFLLLGQDSHGSYGLSTSATSTHGYYVERNILQKVDVINNQLAPRLLAINDIFLDWKDMPEFVAADPNEFSTDEAGKFIQRVASVGKMTPQVLEWLLNKMNAPIDGIEELDFTNKGQSRAGESQGSSGTGNTQDGGVASTVNSENGGTVKNLIVDGDKIIDTETDEVVNMIDLNKDGEYE